MTGYLHPAYAQSLAEFGIPRNLPQSGSWILERVIAEFQLRDGISCYPLFFCQDWSGLHTDLEALRDELISLVIVTDPFGAYDVAHLEQCFNTVVKPFKEHFIADVSSSDTLKISKHHRYYARKSLQNISVETCANPTEFLDEWVGLYRVLTQRHQLSGIQAFSKTAFAKQLSIPGLVIFKASYQGQTVGAHLWFQQGEIAYSHLAAFNDVGYDLMASYALYATALDYFMGKVQWLDIGAGAGTTGQGSSGLSQFKQGWASDTKTVYLCGHIFDQAKYADLASSKGLTGADYFPAYRKGEFD